MYLSVARILLLGSWVLFAPQARTWAGDPPAKDAPVEVEDNIVQQARALRERGDAHRRARRYDQAMSDYRHAVGLLRRREEDHRELATSLNNVAAVLDSLGKATEALPLYREALEMRKRLFPGDHPDVAQSLNNVAVVLGSLGRASEALPLLRRALEMRRRLSSGDHPDVALSLNNVAVVLDSLGKASEALPLVERALEMRKRLFSGNHPDVAQSLNSLAVVLQSLGRAREALPLYEEALAMRRRLSPGDHLHVAESLNNVAAVLQSLGKTNEALPLYEEALEMRRRLLPGDHPHVAQGLNNVAVVLHSLGESSKALSLFEEVLEMTQRLFPGDHPHVANNLSNVAFALHSLGKSSEALPLLERALEMRKRLFPGDHPHVAQSLNGVAGMLQSLGKASEALPLFERALEMTQRLFPGDHPDVALSLNNLAAVLQSLGKAREALLLYDEVLDMTQRLFPGDHAHVALSLNNVATVLHSLGRASEALPLHEEALGMRKRLFPGNHPHVALSLNNVAVALYSLGKASEALPLYEEALEMRKRLFPGDHPEVAQSLNGLASVLGSLGKASEALPLYEEALEMRRRLFPGNHPHVALSLHNVAVALYSLGKATKALSLFEESLEMRRHLFPGDHPEVAQSLDNVALVLNSLGKAREALSVLERTLEMRKRLFLHDHPEVAEGLSNLAGVLSDLGRRREAQEKAEEAIEVGERCRWPGCYMPRVLLGRLHLQNSAPALAIQVLQLAAVQLEVRRTEAASLGTEGRSKYLTELRQWDPFPLLVQAHVMHGDTDRALEALERSRGREMLDLLERGEGNPLRTALASAKERGDEELVKRIRAVHAAVGEAASDVAMATSQAKRAMESVPRAEYRAARRVEREARQLYADALRDRLRVIRDALPEGRLLSSGDVKALLSEGEQLVAYSLGERSFVLVVSRDGIHAHALGTDEHPVTSHAVATAVDAYREVLSEAGATPTAASAHPGARLFQMLIPDAVWEEVQNASRLFVLPHASLHQLPFEALVVRSQSDKPVYWLTEGPPLAYAVSAAVVDSLRARPRATAKAPVVAVGDPLFEGASSWPASGVVVTGVSPDSQAATAQLRPGDVITSYGEAPTSSFQELIAAIQGTEAAVEEVSLGFERDGNAHTVPLRPGRMGVFLAREPPPVAGPKLLQKSVVGVVRSSRGRRLARLPGTREEVNTLAELIKRSTRPMPVRTLLGAEATEAAVFEAATSPRILHLATHGLIEPDQGARASRLALTPPRVPVPGNDGFLEPGGSVGALALSLERHGVGCALGLRQPLGRAGCERGDAGASLGLLLRRRALLHRQLVAGERHLHGQAHDLAVPWPLPRRRLRRL